MQEYQTEQSQRTKLLIISFAWNQKDKGGLGQHALELAQTLSSNAYQITVICIDADASKKPYQSTTSKQDSIDVIEIAYCYHNAKTLHDMQAPFGITKLIKEKAKQIQPAIIHIHHCLYTGFKLIQELAPLAPVIHTLHDYYAITPRGQLLDQNHKGVKTLSEAEWLRQVNTTWPHLIKNSQTSDQHSLMQQWINYNTSCLKHCTRLICPSEGAAEIFRSNNIQIPITVIENGINKGELAGNIKKETSKKASKKIKILILGSITPAKGQLLFCQAIIEANLLDLVEIHLHGPMPETYHGEILQQQDIQHIHQKYPENFFLKGPYDHNELNTIFEQVDILATPSIWEEVYGLVAREGLCYGLPLICTNAAGMRSLKGQTNVFTLNKNKTTEWPGILSKEFRSGTLKQWVQERRRQIFRGADSIRSTDDYACEIRKVYDNCITESSSKCPTEAPVKPTILYLTPSHSSQSFGGTENAATGLYNRLRFDDEQTKAWLLTSSELEGYDQQQLNIPAQTLSLEITAKQPNNRDSHLEKFSKQIQPNIIHLQHYLNLGIDVIPTLRRLNPDAIIVLTLHEYILICPNDGQMIKRESKEICINPSPQACSNCFKHIDVQTFQQRSTIVQAALNACDGLVSPSHWLLRQFEQQYRIPAKSRVIENGLPIELLEQIKLFADDERKHHQRLHRFAFFGRASERKGLLVLLQACHRLSLSHPGKFQLQLHGGGLEQEPAAIQHRIQALIGACGDHVALLGRYQQMQIPQLMQQCDWVIVPSIWWENSPVVIQEAFACGKPVIGSNHGGIAEKITGRGGVGFKPNSAEDLARCMTEAIGNGPLHHTLQEQMAPPFSVEACAAEHLSFYQELMSSHACG